MQPLARDGFTPAQVTALLTAPDLATDFGLDSLDASLNVVDDLTPDLVSGTVSRNMLANAHGALSLVISRELAWGRARVRPWMSLTSRTLGMTCRFALGVYVLTTPDKPLGETPITYSVSGFDQLYLLGGIGDSYSVEAGSNVLAAVRAALVSGGIVAPILLDSSGSAKVLAATMTWPLTSGDAPTWLRVANELLASIGYRGLWVDENGAFQGTPYVLPGERPAEFRLDVGDLVRGVVSQDRTVTNDLWSAPNQWVFVGNNWATAPVVNNGRYETDNPNTGLSSQASVERVVMGQAQFLDATSQADLVAQGDRIKAADMRSTEVIKVSLSPFPAMWHSDRWEYADAALGADRQTVCHSWSLPLDGSDASMELETV